MKNKQPEIPLPKSWGTHVKSAILHVIALGQYALTYSRSWAADSSNQRVRLKAECDRIEQEVALHREEIRIKDGVEAACVHVAFTCAPVGHFGREGGEVGGRDAVVGGHAVDFGRVEVVAVRFDRQVPVKRCEGADDGHFGIVAFADDDERAEVHGEVGKERGKEGKEGRVGARPGTDGGICV